VCQWFSNIVVKNEKFTGSTVYSTVSGAGMLQLVVKVFMSYTLDIKLFLTSINLNMKRIIYLIERICSPRMMGKSSICCSSFKLLWRINIANTSLEQKKKHLKHSNFAVHFTNSQSHGTTFTIFILEFWGLQISIAIVEFTIFNPACMYHWVPIKEMISIVWRLIDWVWTISQIYTVNIIRNLTCNNFD